MATFHTICACPFNSVAVFENSHFIEKRDRDMYLRQYTHSLEISKARGKVKLKKKGRLHYGYHL